MLEILTPAFEAYEKTLEIMKELFRVRISRCIQIQYAYLLALTMGLSGCFVIPEHFDEKSTYKVIAQDTSHLPTARIEGLYQWQMGLVGHIDYYTNVIAIDETKVGDYKYIRQSSDYGSYRPTYAEEYLHSSITAYDTEVSPGQHSLLVLSVPPCCIAEMNIYVESGKNYTVMAAPYIEGVDVIVIDSVTKDQIGGSVWRKIPCESLEEYRDEFIARNKQKVE
jgi:hypothetical protein